VSALLLDVGNSRLKWGVLDEDGIHQTGHVSQEKIREQGLAVLTSKLPRRVDIVRASNVAGTSFGTRLSGVIGIHCNADVHFARSEKRGWGVSNGYRQPRLLGVDRWVAMIAAWAELQSSCLIVDAGTAVTLDAIDDDGFHLGGQIIPGVEAMLDSLLSATSDISLVKISSKHSADDLKMFSRNTAAAIREGSQNAVAGAIERAIRTLQSNSYNPTVILTGGGASHILGALDEAPLHRPDLVLQGLAYMLENDK